MENFMHSHSLHKHSRKLTLTQNCETLCVQNELQCITSFLSALFGGFLSCQFLSVCSEFVRMTQVHILPTDVIL